MLIQNHPFFVRHIPEILSLWRANVESNIVTSWPMLLNYILKYTLKPEVKSESLDSIEEKVLQQVNEECPLRKALSKILTNTITERDISINEALLILHRESYVEFSRKFRYANVEGIKPVVALVGKETELATDNENWHDIYCSRDSDDNFIQFCKNYESGKLHYKCHPKEISLRDFMAHFNKKWELQKTQFFVPVIIPVYRYTVPSNHKKFPSYCKSVLLAEKPGCYLQNIGQGFDSVEAEMKDFVKNSEFCPQLIKDEYAECLIKGELENKDQKKDPKKDKDDNVEINDEDFDQLMVDLNVPEGDCDADTQDSLLAIHGLKKAPKPNENEDSDESDYECEEIANAALRHNWGEEALNWSKDEIDRALQFIDTQMEECELPEVSYQDIDVTKLNTKQRICYDMICNWVKHYLSDPEKVNPFYMNINGSAGTGKSFLLKAISKYIDEKAPGGFIKIAAPTGSAAFQVNGSTLHSLFHLPVPKFQGKEIPDLPDTSLKGMQAAFKNTAILVIDEKSMIGFDMLYMINKRLKELKPDKVNTEFGGVSIILMGDFAQLPPVTDKPLYGSLTTVKDKKNKCYQKGLNLYTMFTKAIVLTEIMRQQGDDEEEFRYVLKQLSKGKFTEKDWEWMKPQNLATMSETDQQQFKDTAIMLCAFNRDRNKHNIYKIKQLGNPVAQLKAENCNSIAANASAQTAGGLPNSSIIAEGAEMMLVVNLWKEAGLTNGAKCTVRKIVYLDNKSPPKLPAFVLVHVPQYTGPSFLEGEANIVPITRLRRNWNANKTSCSRTMIPLQPAYAISVHKSQGMSLDKVMINLGPKEFASGLSYTAISRCKKIQNLAFDPFPTWIRFRDMFKTDNFKAKLREEEKIKMYEIETLKRGHL